MDKKTKGAWVLHHSDKLGRFNDPTGTFDRLHVAGLCGELASAISADGETVISIDTVRDLARVCGINPTFHLPPVLKALREQHLIDTSGDQVQVIGLTSGALLGHVGQIFEASGPGPQERASLALSEAASNIPVRETEAAARISDEYRLTTDETSSFLSQAADLGFTDSQAAPSGGRLFFNGNLFHVGEAAAKVDAVLTSLSADDRKNARDVEARLKAQGCLEVEEAKRILGHVAFKKLHSIGLWDVGQVSNPKESAAFLTRPAAFGKFGSALLDDAFDLAKALVAALTYGIIRSSSGRGRIRYPKVLIRKFVEGAWIGPATAIGEDYRVLETKRVLEVRPEGELFQMRLLKKEVGELALAVLTEGDASGATLETLPGVAATKYVRPERNRELTRVAQKEMSASEVSTILDNLRSNSGGW